MRAEKEARKVTEAERTLQDQPLDAEVFRAIFHFVIREMELVSLQLMMQQGAIQHQMMQDMQNPSPQFIHQVAQRNNMQPDELINKLKANPQFAAALLQKTAQDIIMQAQQELGMAKNQRMLKFMDRACAKHGVTQEQLDAYKRVHEDDVKDTLERLKKVMDMQDLPDVQVPANFTKERCLEYMKKQHEWQEKCLEEKMKGVSMDAVKAGEMPKELEALITGEAFEDEAEKDALEQEYGLVDKDHKAELLIQQFVISNSQTDMAFAQQVQMLQQQHVQNVQQRMVQLKKTSDASKVKGGE